MIKVHAKVNDTKLIQQFKRLDMPTQQRARKEALVAAGQIIATDAKIRAPVLTGNLRRSIHVSIAESNFKRTRAIVGTNVEYAKAVEFGYGNRLAKPFLRQAYIAKREEAVREIRNALKEIIKKSIM